MIENCNFNKADSSQPLKMDEFSRPVSDKNPEVPVVGPNNPVVGYTLPKSDYDRIMEEIENAGF